MEKLLQLTFSGLALGGTYALVALGFVVIYRSSQVFNFAQGEFLIVGAFLMTTLTSSGVPWPAALLVAMLVTGLLGAVIERVVLRPLVGRPTFVLAILTIFIAFLMRTAAVLIWGADTRAMPSPWPRDGTLSVLGARVTYNSIGAMVATAVALLAFFLLFRRSKIGIGMRATATDQEAALGVGIPVGRVFGTAWFIAGATAALGGVFLGMFPRVVEPNLGFVAFRAFPAVLLGGLDSPAGAVTGGLILGVLELLAQGYVNPALGSFGQNFHEVFAYMFMIVVLVVRPYGLFGRRDIERV
ncbi:MAG: branched-chain amino acid ABC transporter permease [Actinobacteria bacterium]|nr:branched-chain amino acid ABC transporter permease [Actinomycetota bacterium]